MAGYNWKEGKSNSAVEAENDGKYPLTKAIKMIAKAAGCTQKEAREACNVVGPTEWHHSSKMFNQVNYYHVEAVVRYIQAKPVIDNLPDGWRDKMTKIRQYEGGNRFEFIDDEDDKLADELQVDRELLVAAYYGNWEIEE